MIRIQMFFASLLVYIAFMEAPAMSQQPSNTPSAANAASSATASAAPQGEVAHYTFTGSRIFPGTLRDYWVYVPRQYDPARPACVFVSQDGVQCDAPAIFDRLIAAGQMPVTIGVFVAPGRLPAPAGETLDRLNRSYEYDGIGDDYVRFLLEEMLPAVETRTAADGRPIHLSPSGNDRCIGGFSSGAACAFTAAWQRPDAFTRVFSGIGTYVAMRGGNVYPTLVRKFEPKPIRIFMQDGSADLNLCLGDWWMANQEMERALTFAGYEVRHAWGEGGHDGRQGSELFPEAMRWLWRDWPAPVKAGPGSPQLQEILRPGEGWQRVLEGRQSISGMAVNARGEVFFSDVPAAQTWKIGLDGQASLWLKDNQHATGQAFGPDGRLYLAAPGAGALVACDADGQTTRTVAANLAGENVVAGHAGGLYVTAPGDGAIWFVNPQGEKKVVDTGLKAPGGLALSPDQWLLRVSDRASHWVYSYQAEPDGSLTHKQRYDHLHVPDDADDSGAGGLCLDRDNRLYVATRMGIQVSDQMGRVICIIPVPGGPVASLCLGGERFGTLYAACGGAIYQRRLKVEGIPSFLPPVKPGAPWLG